MYIMMVVLALWASQLRATQMQGAGGMTPSPGLLSSPIKPGPSAFALPPTVENYPVQPPQQPSAMPQAAADNDDIVASDDPQQVKADTTWPAAPAPSPTTAPTDSVCFIEPGWSQVDPVVLRAILQAAWGQGSGPTRNSFRGQLISPELPYQLTMSGAIEVSSSAGIMVPQSPQQLLDAINGVLQQGGCLSINLNSLPLAVSQQLTALLGVTAAQPTAAAPAAPVSDSRPTDTVKGAAIVGGQSATLQNND